MSATVRFDVVRGQPTEQFMKTRIGSSLATLFALVLLFAATAPSFATQHRDPVIPAESQQKMQSDGSPAVPVQKTKSHPSAKRRIASSNKAAKKSSATSATNTGDPGNRSGSRTSM